MARKHQDNAPAPAAQPAYMVVKREKDRWWEVRDPQGERLRWCVDSPRDRGTSEAAAAKVAAAARA